MAESRARISLAIAGGEVHDGAELFGCHVLAGAVPVVPWRRTGLVAFPGRRAAPVPSRSALRWDCHARCWPAATVRSRAPG
jgi:hypothetical protein